MEFGDNQELRRIIWQVVAEVFNVTLPTAVLSGPGTGVILRGDFTWAAPFITDATGAAQNATHLYGGNGVPSNANGANGDFYFRGDGVAGTFIYHRAGGTWAAFA